ncbi:MAG TPA: hypothetical protein VIU93_12700 [Gallionellaceae bacterium]
MKNQPQYPGVERRKKERVPLEVPLPARPQSGQRTALLVAAAVLAIVGLVGLFTIFWMGVVGKV